MLSQVALQVRIYPSTPTHIRSTADPCKIMTAIGKCKLLTFAEDVLRIMSLIESLLVIEVSHLSLDYTLALAA